MNTLKTTLFLVLLTLLLVGIGHLLGGQQGMMVAFIFALAMNFVSYWFSDKIVLMMYRAKPVAEAELPELHRIVRTLAQQAQMPMPRLYRIPTETPNAFATGRSPNHAAVAVTDGILKVLTWEELEGVLAHELSHVQNRDVLISTIAAAIAGAIYMLARMAQWGAMFGGHRRDNRNNSGGAQLALMLVIAIVAPIAAMLIQIAISRSREYQADASGAKMCHKPLALANALRKIHQAASRVPMDANPATAHLFIVNPLTGRSLMNMFSTHPPVERRVEILENMARQGV
ncbi:MAG: zinc metalloprotease HtpX [Candidatus Omnitrophica bacterium]|nr:zinc metalloprotease HtpX [Candidatus Omnitrophota bacterium]